MVAQNRYDDNQPDLQRLKAQIDLREVVATYWGKGKRVGQGHQYRSRWRDDGQKISFTIYKDHFHDYGGELEHGDIFDWLQREGIVSNLPEAIDWASNYIGQPRRSKTDLSALPAQKTSISGSATPGWQKAAQQVLERGQKYLWSERSQAKQIQAYLRKSRGLRPETVRKYGLAYLPEWTRTKYRNPETGTFSTLAPGIYIPIFLHGRIVALRVRCRVGNLAEWLGIDPDVFSFGDRAGEELPKYMNLAGSRLSGTLFNGDMIMPRRPVVFVEGEFDAMLGDQEINASRDEDDLIAVVTLGSASNRIAPEWLEQLHTVEDITLILDRDAAGQQASYELSAKFNHRCRILHPPEGKDITDFVVQYHGDLAVWFAENCHPAWWPNGIPDSWRSALLNYIPTKIAPIVELLNHAMRRGLVDQSDFTVQDVLKANEVLGYDIPPGTIRSAMKPLSALFLFKLETNKHQEIVSKFEKNSSRGRKAVSYQARPLNDIQSSLIDWVAPRIYETEHPVLDNPILARPTARMMEALNVDNATRIAQELDERYRPAYQHQRHRERFAEQRAQRNLQRLIKGLDNWYSTPLPPGWPVSNASNYRVAFLRALTQAQPDRPFSRRELQAVLGIANGSIKSMVKRAGLEAEPQFQEHSAPVTGDIAKAVMQMGRDQQGYPRDLIIRSSNDQDIVLPYDVRSAPGIIKQQAAKGASVAIKFQTPNTYRSVRNTPQPAIKPPARSTGVHRPSTTHSAQKLTTGRYFGPNYDVRWVKGQLEVAFVKLGWHSNDQLVNPHTGELLDDRQVHTLLEILLGRSATSETVALPHRQRRPFDPTPEEEAEMWKRIELLRMFVR